MYISDVINILFSVKIRIIEQVGNMLLFLKSDHGVGKRTSISKFWDCIFHEYFVNNMHLKAKVLYIKNMLKAMIKLRHGKKCVNNDLLRGCR